MIPFVGLEGTRDMRCNWIRGLLLTIVLFCGATAVCADAARVPSRPVARMKSGGKVQNLWRQKATTRVVVPAKMSEKRLRPPRSWFVMNMAVVNCLTVSGAALLLLALLKIAFRRSASLREFDREATVPLRGILALLVVVGHLWGYDGKPDNLMQYLSCGPTAVSVFFFMSGYGYEKSFRRKGESYLNGLFGRTLWKLLIPMAIASLVYCVVTIFVMGDFDPWKLLCGYVRGRTGFLPQSWYVYMLMMFAFVVALGRRRIGLIGIWIAVIGIELVVGSVLKWPMCWWASDYAFPVGMTFAACEPRIRSLISGHPVKVYGVALAALLLSVFVVVCGNGYGDSDEDSELSARTGVHPGAVRTPPSCSGVDRRHLLRDIPVSGHVPTDVAQVRTFILCLWCRWNRPYRRAGRCDTPSRAPDRFAVGEVAIM